MHHDVLTYEPEHNPGYISPWSLEMFSLQDWRVWFHKNWTFSIYISTAYLSLIFLGQLWMKGRNKIYLTPVLFLWNVSLAIFSMIATFRLGPEFIHIFSTKESGLYNSVCLRDGHSISSSFWGLLFTLSKAVELGDTAFIVLRKQPLIFLHWYHHITVLGYTWYTYETYDSTSRWFMMMNYLVHSLMYSYYALKTLRIPVTPVVAKTITTLQLTQMVLGLGVNLYALAMKHMGVRCQVETEHIHLALIMYCTYFLLFAHFFINSYIKKRSVQKLKTK